MAKRTNRVAWGLVVALAVLLLMALAAGYAGWSAGAESSYVMLLEPGEWGFSRGMGDNNDGAHPMTVEWINLGFVAVVRLNHVPPEPADPKASVP